MTNYNSVKTHKATMPIDEFICYVAEEFTVCSVALEILRASLEYAEAHLPVSERFSFVWNLLDGAKLGITKDECRQLKMLAE